MDLNYYLEREQVERVRAQAAGHSAAASAHQSLADLYRQQIEQYRESNQVQAGQVQASPRAGR
jgi:hypothetical protein